VGCDRHKKITGRKRHILVETLELIVAGVVTAANPDNRLGLVLLLQRYCALGRWRLSSPVVVGVGPLPQTDAQGGARSGRAQGQGVPGCEAPLEGGAHAGLAAQ